MNKSFFGIYRCEINKYSGATRTILMYILSKCNHSDNDGFMFDNVNFPLKRGQLITSLSTICEGTGLSRQSVRTVLKNLKKSQNLTDLSTGVLTNRARLLTIVNIDDFLVKPCSLTHQSTHQSTDTQHTPNTPLTPINKNNNENKTSICKKTNAGIKNKFKPPVVKDVIEYFKEKGYPEELAIKAFEYYEIGNWKDSTGKQVKNWKQKMMVNWFKDKNKQKRSSGVPIN